MMASVVDALSGVLILAGAFFTLVGMVGLIRMPEVFTRMHAASVTETLGAGLLLIGLMLQAGLTLVTLKLIFILALLVFTGPVITHALAQAALHAGIGPALDDDRRDRLTDKPVAPPVHPDETAQSDAMSGDSSRQA